VDQAGSIAIFDTGVWSFLTPQGGWQAFVRDVAVQVFFDGSVWANVAVALESLQNMQLLGVNTTADTTNRLAVTSPATLLNHEGSDHRLKINKASSTDTTSLLFQSGFAGHAEMGLAGSNGFGVRVSDDGATWVTAFEADGATGAMSLPQGAVIVGALTLVYDRVSRLEVEWTFPMPFASGSEVSSSMSLRNESQATPDPEDMGFVGCRAGSGDRNLSVRLRAYRITGTVDFDPADEMVAFVTSIGRWF
jgi:hypothetical protein